MPTSSLRDSMCDRLQQQESDEHTLRSVYIPAPVTSQEEGAEVAAFLHQYAPQNAERSVSTIAGNPDAYAIVRNGLGDVVAGAEVMCSGSSGWYQAEVRLLVIHPQAPPAQITPALTAALIEQTRRQRTQALALYLPTVNDTQAEALRQAEWRPVATILAPAERAGQTLWYRAAAPHEAQPLPDIPDHPDTAPRPGDQAHIRAGSNLTNHDCDRVAELLNTQNHLSRHFDGAQICNTRNDYLVATDAQNLKQVQGCVAVVALSDTVAEVRHLSVDTRVHRQGYGRRLLRAAEERAQQLGVQVQQATVRADNDASRTLFMRAGYTRTTTFRNINTGNIIEVWHRPINTTLPANISPPSAASAVTARHKDW